MEFKGIIDLHFKLVCVLQMCYVLHFHMAYCSRLSLGRTTDEFYNNNFNDHELHLSSYEATLAECNEELKFETECYITVNNYTEKVLHAIYNLNELEAQHKAIRIHVTSNNADKRNPVLFVVKQQLGIISWQLPFQLDSFFNFYEVNRTLCPVMNYPEAAKLSQDQDLVVDVSTYSPTPVSVSIMIKYVKNFFLELNYEQPVTISPSAPQYFEMIFPNNTNVIVVSVTSEDNICAIVSIQPIECPVFDLDKNVQYNGIYQTMTNKAAITIKKTDFKSGKFYVVFVAKSSDYDCTGIEKIRKPSVVENRTKLLTVLVRTKITEDEYLTATIGALVLFLVFYVVSIVVAFVFCIVKRKAKSRNNNSLSSSADAMHSNGVGNVQDPLTTRGETSYGSMSAANELNPVHPNSKTKYTALSLGSASPSDLPFDDEDDDDDDSSVNEDEVDMLPDADSDKNILRTKTFLYVVDLARKDPKFLNRKSQLYLWHMFIVAVFYALPVIQLVITYQSVSHVTGNQDICYYNFLCTYPVGTITDFNHVYSNIGYVMLGFLFIGLVWRKDLIHKERMAMNDLYEKNYGIPRHFGLFYAMGTALMMEGILSGSYHVCPNYSNFQFDTSFMYLIASLCMLKIYQTRHPDINANAHASFMVFAIVIFIGVVGVVYGTLYFWIAFAVIHIMSCIALSAQIYYMGIWNFNFGIFRRIYLTMKTDLMSATHCCRPMYMDRLILLIIVNCINWTFALAGLVLRPHNFASYLLTIFIVNLLMYVTFYIIMKLRSGEKILLLPIFYIVMSIITWTAALYYFMQATTSWELTPAQSRIYNKPCIILNFYDDHDVWHFLSAASMFFSFMILLTLDDDLVHTPRDKIAVF